MEHLGRFISLQSFVVIIILNYNYLLFLIYKLIYVLYILIYFYIIIKNLNSFRSLDNYINFYFI
jgi:hypothetical protein